ncbi:MAG: YfhO family protein [Gemmatimonadota bacterium]
MARSRRRARSRGRARSTSDPRPPPGTAAPASTGRAAATPRPASRGAGTERPRRGALPEAGFALAFAAACGLLALVFFREFVLRGGTMPFGTDMLEEAYPLRNFAVEELRAGRPFPVWNPFAYSGIPFLETLPYPVFYPTSLLYFVLPLGRAIGWTFVLHFAAAGVFMFAFARRLGVSRWGAALAGLAFLLNGYTVSHLYAGQDGRMFAMTLIPLVFFFLRVGLDTDRLGPYLLMGGAVALQVFTPHVQVMYFSSLAACAYVLVEALARWRRDGARPALATLGRFAAGFGLAAGVAAVQLWPTLTFLQWAVRGAESGYAYASSWALPAGELTALLIPDLVGSLDSYWGANPFKLHTEYLGAVPLVLALAALLWGARGHTLFWALLAVAGVLFALGAATPVHRIAYEIVPMIRSFRAPAMMLGVVAFAVATLAGIGFDAAAAAGRERDAPGGARAWLFLGAAGLVLLAWLLAVVSPQALAGLAGDAGTGRGAARAASLARLPVSLGVTALAWAGAAALLWWGLARSRLRPPLVAGAVAVLLVTDLWRVDARYLDVVEVDRAFAAGSADEFLQRQDGPFRILALPGTLGPNEAILHRLEAVWGLQKFRLRWYDTLLGGSAAANVGRLPLWRVLNLRYVINPTSVDAPGLSPVHEGPPAVLAWEGEAPRAWVAREARVVDDSEALARLSDPAFDVGGVALLAEPLPLDDAAPTPEGARGASAARGSVRYLEYQPNHLLAEVTSPAPGYAVFSEAYHPYWTATIDGETARVVRADLAFRAVPVPAGTHRVRMEYRPRAFERARWVSLATLAAALSYGLAGGLGGRRGHVARLRGT